MRSSTAPQPHNTRRVASLRNSLASSSTCRESFGTSAHKAASQPYYEPPQHVHSWQAPSSSARFGSTSATETIRSGSPTIHGGGSSQPATLAHDAHDMNLIVNLTGAVHEAAMSLLEEHSSACSIIQKQSPYLLQASAQISELVAAVDLLCRAKQATLQAGDRLGTALRRNLEMKRKRAKQEVNFRTAVVSLSPVEPHQVHATDVALSCRTNGTLLLAARRLGQTPSSSASSTSRGEAAASERHEDTLAAKPTVNVLINPRRLQLAPTKHRVVDDDEFDVFSLR